MPDTLAGQKLRALLKESPNTQAVRTTIQDVDYVKHLPYTLKQIVVNTFELLDFIHK